MNAQELIESGKLELYVAGVLCGKERDQVASMVLANRLLQAEVRAMEDALLAGLNEGKFEPRAEVKNEIMSAIKNEGEVVRKLNPTQISKEGEGKVVAMNPTNRWLVAASVGLLVGLGVTFYTLNQKTNSLQSALTALNEKYNSQVVETEMNQKTSMKYAEQLALINDLNTKKILLNGVALSPDSKAIVYWNTLNGRVILNTASLPTPPTDMQYQLWALLDGKPIDAGVFNVTTDSSNLQEVKNIGKAQAFAVTFEHKGGVASPTLTAMYAIGAI